MTAPSSGVTSRDQGLVSPKSWLTDLVLLAAIWGSSFLFMRISAVEFGALPTAAVRVTIAALFLLPLVWLRGLLPELKKHTGEKYFLSAFSIQAFRSRALRLRCCRSPPGCRRF